MLTTCQRPGCHGILVEHQAFVEEGRIIQSRCLNCGWHSPGAIVSPYRDPRPLGPVIHGQHHD